jgi:DNA polymerase-3 subunit epsilon
LCAKIKKQSCNYSEISNTLIALYKMYSIVDIETTGSRAFGNSITEIAILVHDGYNVVDEFHTLVNPGVPIPYFITSLTGINNAMVAGAPDFSEIAEKVHAILSQTIFVAHNVGFDYSFVKNELKLSGYQWAAEKLCTVRMGRKFLPGFESYSLGRLCESLDIEIEARHRAYGDAKATVEVFERILKNGGEEFFQSKYKLLNKQMYFKP